MDNIQKVLITVIVLGVLVIGFYLLSFNITNSTGFAVKEDGVSGFSSCLREKNVILYVNSNELSATLKGIMAFDYLKDVRIMNCFSTNNACIKNGISSFPTWVIEGNKVGRDVSLEELSKFSGCKL